MARQYIESKNVEYIERDLRIRNYEYGEKISLTPYDAIHIESKKDKDRCFRMIQHCYEKLMENSTVITNSEFTRGSISNIFNGGINRVHVIRPPVDVEAFHNVALMSSVYEREDTILVISRINKHKEIENAINLAKLLKKNKIGKRMRILGNINYVQDSEYYLFLHKMVRFFDLEDYVTIETNVSFNNLISAMKKAKTYFHPMIGEHFGIAVVEAMAAGLVPIVPAVGGPTEFVPSKYHFNSLEEAADKISTALQVENEERVRISDSVNRFSLSNFINQFQNVVSRLLN